MTTRTKPTNCPYCNHNLEALSDLDDKHVPSPGDVSVCINCANILVITKGLGVRIPTPEELNFFESDSYMKKIQYLIRTVVRIEKAKFN